MFYFRECSTFASLLLLLLLVAAVDYNSPCFHWFNREGSSTYWFRIYHCDSSFRCIRTVLSTLPTYLFATCLHAYLYSTL
jgi:hypothetical protein